jgi:hypothetical protein
MGNSLTESITATEDVEKYEKKIETKFEPEIIQEIQIVEEKLTTDKFIKFCIESDSTSLDLTGFS